MRVIDRLNQYLEFQRISPYAFERTCTLANGYFKKQLKGKGSIGSDILEKIGKSYPDLSLEWLLSGKGKMFVEHTYPLPIEPIRVAEERTPYSLQEHIIRILSEKCLILENALADKEKIIRLLDPHKGTGDRP